MRRAACRDPGIGHVLHRQSGEEWIIQIEHRQIGISARRQRADRLIQRTGADLGPPGRDGFAGWGRLDVAAALQAATTTAPPPADRLEPNDDAGMLAPQLYGSTKSIAATLDYWDDDVDVYRVKVRAGQRIVARLTGPAGTDTNLVLWKPGTQRVEGLSAQLQGNRATQSAGSGPDERFTYRAQAGGWYYLEVKLATPGAGVYTLRYSKTP